jgi:hypothetical protein
MERTEAMPPGGELGDLVGKLIRSLTLTPGDSITNELTVPSSDKAMLYIC